MMMLPKKRFAPLNSSPDNVNYSPEYLGSSVPGLLEQVAGKKSKDIGWDYSCLCFDSDAPGGLQISSSTAQGRRDETNPALYHKHYRDYPYIVATFESLAAACHFLTHTKKISISYEVKVYNNNNELVLNSGRGAEFIAHHARQAKPDPQSSGSGANIITPNEWQPAWLKGRFDGRKTYRIRINDPSGWGNHTWSDQLRLPDDQRVAIWSQAYTNTDINTARETPLEWSRDNEGVRFFGIIRYKDTISDGDGYIYGILGNTTFFGGFYWESEDIPDLICSIAGGLADCPIATPFGTGYWHPCTGIDLPLGRAMFSNVSIVVS